MRDRLIELLGDYLYAEQIADHLLANGVVVPPCKVGDTVYATGLPNTRIFPKVVEGFVIGVDQREYGLFLSVLFDTRKISGTYDYNTKLWLGKKLFLTKEEAEAKLKEVKG
jgi:hypothetical protein